MEVRKEKIKKLNSGSLKLKLLLIVGMVVTGILFQRLVLNSQKKDNDVLGSSKNESKASVSSLRRSLTDEVGQQVNEIKDNVLGTATSLVGKKIDETKDKIADTVFQGTAKGISDQIDKLPKEQQDELKKYLCK